MAKLGPEVVVRVALGLSVILLSRALPDDELLTGKAFATLKLARLATRKRIKKDALVFKVIQEIYSTIYQHAARYKHIR